MLEAVEQEFFALRRTQADVASACQVAMAHATGAEPPDARLLTAAEAIVDAVEKAALDGELAYHNRHHVVEAVLAMGWLCGSARRAGAVSASVGQAAIVAMVGHDLLHDGSPPGGGLLEARSAAAVERALAGFDLSARQRAIIRATIVGTDPDLVASNAARAAGGLPPGPLGAEVDLLVAMANEADICASLLPRLGSHLTRMLVRERRQSGFPAAAEITGLGRRIAFLGAYARMTPAAIDLGLADLRASQVSEGEQLVAARRGVRALEARLPAWV